MNTEKNKTLKEITKNKYQYGFVTKLKTEKIEPGLNEHIIKFISSKRGEPSWMLDYSLKAFKNGGWFGKGPGQGILKEKIPDANTDFIFAVAGEELGFIFCSIIILLILTIIIRLLLKLLKMQDPYIIISIVGLTCCFGLQSLINIFSSLSIIPTKGMTLPYISYGGSSMISSSILFGFLLAFTKNKNSYE